MYAHSEWTFLDEFVSENFWGLQDEVFFSEEGKFFYCNLEVSLWEMILKKGEKKFIMHNGDKL